jgi:hypothetical protein
MIGGISLHPRDRLKHLINNAIIKLCDFFNDSLLKELVLQGKSFGQYDGMRR